MPKPIIVEHDLTPEHFIALWLAIHGGDPAPDSAGVLRAGAAVLEHTKKVPELQGQVVEAMTKVLQSYR